MEAEWVKENKAERAPLSAWWLAAALLGTAGALGGVALIDHALPAPLPPDGPPLRFLGQRAHRHLVALAAIGPRVAGSYENEVLAVSALVSAIRRIAEEASPHNRVELDVHTASGAFSLSFMDGMNNVYRDVQSVVARVRGAGGGTRARSALLLNCHFDTVPDSPGASDDGAGCAVLLESMRALAAGAPLRHDALFLFNGAEENIMQASHGFITQHEWAKSVRAFINIEACGAGGREVLFQAGPHDPWIVEVYAGAVPHPFASSLAQELFQSGVVPADTDFRIFRDFGNLSGVDLAWSSNGYVYHTRLDTAARVSPAVLQRTGDNVLALARGVLASPALQAERDASPQPVFFDVLGAVVLCARAPAAALVALATLALVVLKIHLNAIDASRQLYVSRATWWRLVARAALAGALAQAGGALAAPALALALHAAGARLAFYSRAWLLAPLYGAPALCASWALARGVGDRAAAGGRAAPLRGWRRARAWHDAGAAHAGALLALCAARRLRSGFVPLLWALLPSAGDALASALRAGPRARAGLWALGAALPALQTCYLALGALRMLVPLTGRAGAGPLPPDVTVSALVAVLALAACGWLLPLLAAARSPRRVLGALAALGAAAALLALLAPRAYSAERPQRLMLFHTRRSVHAAAGATVDHFYWIPDLDVNTPRSVAPYAPELRAARAVTAAECEARPYCGAPYYLPVLRLVGASHVAPAPEAPLTRLHAHLALEERGRAATLHLNITGPAHVVLIVAPARGVRVVGGVGGGALREGAAWGARRTYFVALHAARAPRSWDLSLHFEREVQAAELEEGEELEEGGARWADVSLAGHSLWGSRKLSPAHSALLQALPDWVAATGWGVDLHLHRL